MYGNYNVESIILSNSSKEKKGIRPLYFISSLTRMTRLNGWSILELKISLKRHSFPEALHIPKIGKDYNLVLINITKYSRDIEHINLFS